MLHMVRPVLRYTCKLVANGYQVSFHVRGFVRTRGGRHKCVLCHLQIICVFDDLQGIFVCPSCTESTGRRTISEYRQPSSMHRHIYIVIPRYVVVKSQRCRLMPRIAFSFASTISGVLSLSSWRCMRGFVICTWPSWPTTGAS